MKKTDIAETLNMVDKLYGILAEEDPEGAVLKKTLPSLAKLCIALFPLLQKNSFFLALFGYVDRLLSETTRKECKSPGGGNALPERKMLLQLLSDFELSLMENIRFKVFFKDCAEADIPLNTGYAEVAESSYETGGQDLTVLIYKGAQVTAVPPGGADLYFRAEDTLFAFNAMAAELGKPDYFRYDRLYLESKLESLQTRQDIRLLLAGSSYTMCGLFEKHMPFPARNTAVDAQDIYYTIKTVYKALDYNQNITHCIISLPYYFWGYDISRSTSILMQRRVAEVEYPVFQDRHHYEGPVDGPAAYCPGIVTPLQKRIFAFEKYTEEIVGSIKKGLADAHYFQNPRIGSLICTSDEDTNRKFAQMRTASHNKFYKYAATVEENRALFSGFLQAMNKRGLQLLFFVPPAAKYYRDCLDPNLKLEFYKYLNPLKEYCDFKIVDLLDSDIFRDEDFFDYDHVNDQGAKKLGERLVKELVF